MGFAHYTGGVGRRKESAKGEQVFVFPLRHHYRYDRYDTLFGLSFASRHSTNSCAAAVVASLV